MATCGIDPSNKRKYISEVGEELTRRHGKKKFYKPEEIREASRFRGYPIDWACWAYCFFSTPADFEAVHRAMGESCDYVAMKAELVKDLAGNASSNWFSLDLSWLDWPDVEFSSLFDWFTD